MSGRLALFAAWLLAASPAAAALSIFPADPADTFQATTDCDGSQPQNCSLREAVVLANQSPGQDTIFLVLDHYALSIPRAPSDDAQSGDLDVTEDVIVTDLTSPAAEIDGGGSGGTFLDRLFEVQAGATLTLNNVHLENGYRSNEGGGAVLVDSGAGLVVNGSQFTGNAASGGGAIVVSSGASASIDLSLISGNNALGLGGGGINCAGGLTVMRTAIESNQAGVNGGLAVGVGGAATITKSSITNNQATNTFWGAAGGGIGVAACGSVTLDNVTVSDNSAKGVGGGISIAANYGFCPPGVVTANNVTLAFNTADSDNNDTGSLGGGVWTNAGACAYFTGYCLHIKNSIIGNNKDGPTASDCVGTITSDGNNMLGLCTATASTGDLTTDPLLDPVLSLNADTWTGMGIDNATKTHGLLTGSPAIDSANASTCLATDQRNVGRIGTCDRGAFEADVCGNGTARSPEECDPPSAYCTVQCRDDNPVFHNAPLVTDRMTVGLVVAYQDCAVGNPGLSDPENGQPACNVKAVDTTNGACEFDDALTGAKGFVEMWDDTSNGGQIKLHLRLARLKSACYNRQFRMKVAVQETVKDCTNGGKSCTEVQSAVLDDVAPTGSCRVGDGTGGTTAGLCDYTVILNNLSTHKVRNNHKTAMKVRDIQVLDIGSGLANFVPGVVLR